MLAEECGCLLTEDGWCRVHPICEGAKPKVATLQRELDEARHPKIATRCPSCGRTTLFLDDSGNIVCSWIGGDCRQPVVERAIAEERSARQAAESRTASMIQALEQIGNAENAQQGTLRRWARAALAEEEKSI